VILSLLGIRWQRWRVPVNDAKVPAACSEIRFTIVCGHRECNE
jgi:hypothetical protein